MTTEQIDITEHLDLPNQQLPPQLLPIIWQHRKMIYAGAFIGLLLGIAIALARPTTYTSSATLLFPSGASSKLAALTGGGGGDQPSIPLLDGALQVPQPGTSTSTAMVILQSRRVALDIADGEHLRKVWKLKNESEVLKKFHDALTCSVGKNGELIISFTDGSKARSYRITRSLIQQLEDRSQEMGLNPAEQSVSFIADQLATAQEKLDASERNMLAFQQKYRIISLPDQAKAIAVQYSQVQGDLTTARVEAMTSMRLVNMQASAVRQLITSCVDPASGTTAAGGNSLNSLYKQVTDLQTGLALLRQKFTAEHPDVVEKTQQLAVAQQTLRAEIERQMSLLKTGSSPAISDAVVKAASSQAKFAGLQSAFRQLQQQVDALPQQQATFARLSTELQANTEEVKLFREELEKARIVADRHGPTFIIVDPPAMPMERDPKHRLVVLAIMTLLGCGVALLFPYWQWANRLQSYEQT